MSAVTGDFNGDGSLDVVVSYINQFTPGYGLVFLPGKKDGTFGTPVPFSQGSGSGGGPVLVADLNNDQKLDLIWNNAVYLGNGDGTFRQMPLGLGYPQAIGDLNGDGKADLVIGASVYAGIGDGTFQTTPFYIAPLPQYSVPSSAVIGDVIADGHVDLLLQLQNPNIIDFFGDGHGNFVADSNTYYSYGNNGVLARLNNQAPMPPNDNALDYLAFGVNFAANRTIGATSLLNQLNPSPSAPSLLPSRMTLTASANSAAPNQQLTLTAAVTGLSPTGSVSFVTGSKTLRQRKPIINGTATLPLSFTATGVFPVIANYPGDSNNLASASSPLNVTHLTDNLNDDT